MFGWQAALDALILLFVPIKGSWLGILIPHVWTVFANFFMLWAPIKLKKLHKASGRVFAVAFAIAAAVPLALLFFPESMQRLLDSLEIGFAVWALAIIGASASFSWTVWRTRMALLPQALMALACFGGLLIWSPYLQSQEHRAQEKRERAAKQAEAERQRDAENAATKNAIAQHGLLAFNEPLTDTQLSYLETEILSGREFASEELIAASKHYQNPRIMIDLAENRSSPPEALQLLGQHMVENERANPSDRVAAQQLYRAIAKNPNASADLMLTMLRSGSAGQRAAALESGKLPQREKMAYLEKGCTLTDDYEMVAVARDRDTPVPILECLSSQPSAAQGVAFNSHTPTPLLEEMSRASDWRIANDAKIALKDRKPGAK